MLIFCISGGFSGCALTELNPPDSLVEIADSAFAKCNNLTSVHIPKGIEIIGGKAFTGESLTEFTVSDENKSFAASDGVLFSKDLKSLIMYPSERKDKKYTVPEGCEEIVRYSFPESCSVVELTLPEGLRSMTFSFSDYISDSKVEQINFQAALKARC